MGRPEWTAPHGAEWMCMACGRHGKERDRVGDESCYLNAVLVVAGTVTGGGQQPISATLWTGTPETAAGGGE